MLWAQSLQADPWGAGGSPDLVLPAGAHHPRSEPGPGQLRTQKYPPGVGEEGGQEGARTGEDGEFLADGTCSGNDLGIEWEEQRDPEVPRGIGVGLQPDPGIGGTSGEVVNKAYLYDRMIESGDFRQGTKLFCERWAMTSEIFWIKCYFKQWGLGIFGIYVFLGKNISKLSIYWDLWLWTIKDSVTEKTCNYISKKSGICGKLNVWN